ncbi:SDR family oxidoreductase [Luteolibacter luteus]|uniref:NAD-dependent epimerase/dehydratase family protein n=1 Tax=Luteolibacter luteus TaxID=2728835 RepID=A0A858RHW3_9BACT|nr:SDR family oxidoreductase [Luteolibacter luteus]QJE96009.1 NAD-dependent epimerase/dehydratase family protein [Luteolibacter luteus]
MKILLTGYTGNLGPAIARELSEHEVIACVRNPEAAPKMGHVRLVQGTLMELPRSVAGEIEVIIHAAANTSFVTPLDDLRITNVEGTRSILEFSRARPRLEKIIHVSTACVCGKQSGSVPEARLPKPASFVNAYEESKWEAEELVFNSDLPTEVIRLSIVAGSETDGSVRRTGALHHTLYWLWKGLIPMMPGSPDSLVDLISTEHAAQVVAGRAVAGLQPKQVTHGCAGEAAPRLGELLDHLTTIFSKRSPAWERGSITPPMIVDAATFALFEETVAQSGDLLFRRICQDSRSFLPGLLHPRQYETTNSGTPATDWRHLAELVTGHVIDSRS